MMQTSKKLNVIKIIKTALAVLWWGAVIGLAFLLVSIIGAKLKGEVPKVFGYSVMQIVSGSMEDKIPTGTYILIKEVDASEIKRDDIICFFSDDRLIQGHPNTHRVIADPIQGENGLEFITKGDANPKADDVTAKEDRLIGRYVKSLNGLTAFTKALEGNGMITIMMVIMVASVGMVVYPAFSKAKKEAETSEESSKTDEDDGGCSKN